MRGILLSGGPSWIFVRGATLLFVGIALARLLPAPNRQVPHYRPRPFRAAARLLVLSAATLSGISVTIGSTASVITESATVQRAPSAAPAIELLGVAGSPGSFGRAVGREPDVVLEYADWPSRFSAPAGSAEPLIQLLPWHTRLQKIVAGRTDGSLRRYARACRAYGRPLMLGFGAEMNGWWQPWGWTHQSPREFVRAWRHVVRVFQAEGASNVQFVWTINRGVTGRMGPLSRYWPGGRYVDLVGLDAYYFKRSQRWSRIVQPTVDAVRRLTDKPVFLSETAVGPRAGVRGIRNLFAGIRRDHMLGLVWFDFHQHGGLARQDWRLEDRPRAARVFRSELRRAA